MFKRRIICLVGLVMVLMHDMRAITSIIPAGLLSNQQIASSSLDNDALGSSSESTISTGLFVIEKTGYYFLANDVVANPTYPNNAIIYIDASNTILDLGGKTLSLSSTSHTSNIIGIKIAPGRTNVTIFNGGIIGYSSLTVPETSYPISSINRLVIGIDADGNGNIQLQDLLISECASFGIAISNTNDIKVKNVSTQSIGGVVSTLSPLCGAQFSSCRSCFITDSVFDYTNSVYEDGNNVYGLRLNACGNVTISNVSTSSNQAFGSGNVYGLSLLNSTGCRIDQVHAVNNLVSNDDAPSQISAGIILDGSTGNTLKNCITNSQLNNGANILTCTTYGVRITASSNSNNFIGCISSDNVGGASSEGFSLNASSYNIFEKCIANGNNSPYPGISNITVYGFHSEFGTGNIFSYCEARGNPVYLGAVDETALDGLGATPQQVATQLVSGISIRSENASSILFSTISSNLGGALGTVYGIRLYGGCQGCTVSYNEIFSNLGFKTYGFKDYAAHCSTLLRGNIAYGHGNVFWGGEGVITDSGNMNYMMSYANSADQMSVQMVVKESDIANMNAFEVSSTKWYNFSILGKAISG